MPLGKNSPQYLELSDLEIVGALARLTFVHSSTTVKPRRSTRYLNGAAPSVGVTLLLPLAICRKLGIVSTGPVRIRLLDSIIPSPKSRCFNYQQHY